MNLLRVRRLFAGERVARFGTTGPGDRPHITPVPFAVIDDGDEGVVVCALDAVHIGEPQSIASAARVRDVSAHPRVSLLVDGATDAGARWWVHADAVAEVLRYRTADPRFDMAAAALDARYRGSGQLVSAHTIVWCTVTAWTGWTAGMAMPERAA